MLEEPVTRVPASRDRRGKRVFVHVSTCYVGYPKGTTEPTAENRGDVPEAATDFPYPKEAESLLAPGL